MKKALEQGDMVYLLSCVFPFHNRSDRENGQDDILVLTIIMLNADWHPDEKKL